MKTLPYMHFLLSDKSSETMLWCYCGAQLIVASSLLALTSLTAW